MSKKDTITIPISESARAELEKLAEARAQTTEDVAGEALQTYLSVQAAHVEEITRALEESEQPDARFVPHEEIVAWVESQGTDHPLPMPTARPLTDL